MIPSILTMKNGDKLTDIRQWPLRRKELLQILSEEEYGEMPPVLGCTRGEIVKTESKCCAGHADLETIRITFPAQKGEFSFPVTYFAPTDRSQKYPLFVLLNFRSDVYDMYYPAEEIVDNGFALVVIHYKAITSDDDDMTNGLAGMYDRSNSDKDPGKLTLWAFAMSRAIDYFLTRSEVDAGRIAVIGHSRLGKTALLCGAFDERVRYTFANDSGCGGDAMEHYKHEGAETIEVMNDKFPYWFNSKRGSYAGKEQTMPFDQHFLMAAIAPRFVSTGSAAQDIWADPYAQQLCCVEASCAWEFLGLKGFEGPKEMMAINTACLDGSIGHHYRDGIHFLSRQDWLQYMEFMKKHK